MNIDTTAIWCRYCGTERPTLLSVYMTCTLCWSNQGSPWIDLHAD